MGTEEIVESAAAGPPWASTDLALRLTPIAADELAVADLPRSRRSGGYDPGAADVLLGRALLALRLAEEQLGDLHEALAAARAAAVVVATPDCADGDATVAAAVGRWLDAVAPERIEQLVADVSARQLVDASVYAEAIRREARDRVSVIVDLLRAAADQLDRIVAAGRGTLAGQQRLGLELGAWHGRFQAAVAEAFAALDLPPSTKAAALVACATRELAGG